MGFSFPKLSRLLKSAHFKEIGRKGRRYAGEHLFIEYRPSHKPKLGLTVPRQSGDSVARNRFKRLVREAFRLNQAQLAPLEMVVRPKKGTAILSLEIIVEDLLGCSREYQHSQSPATKSR